MPTLLLAHGLAIQDDRLLLAASRYASHPQPLWNLPGGRVERDELVHEAVVREVREETGLDARIRDLAYVSESYDGELHVIATVFSIEISGTMRTPGDGDHVVAAAWVARGEIAERITVPVIREPLLGHLADGTRYFGTHRAGVTIRW